MKTDPKNQARVQGQQLHPEQTSSNNNPRKLYEVVVHRTDYCYATIRVEAESEDEAETQAEEIAELQPEANWDAADRELYAFSVEQMKEGGSHV